MSDNSTDVLLISADEELRRLVRRHCPPDARVSCVSPGAFSGQSATDSPREQWIDLDGLDCRALPAGPGKRVYFYSEPPPANAGLPAGLFIRKPCAGPVLDVLFARSSQDAPSSTPPAASTLPAWVSEYHTLDLAEFCRRCVATLPQRLGYRDISIYTFDSRLSLLTLAETNAKRPIDLAVRVDEDSEHLMVAVARSGKILIAEDLAHDARTLRVARPRYARPASDARCLVAPLISERRLWGVINLSRRTLLQASGAAALSDAQIEAVVGFLARCMQHAREHERARTEARVDELTGLYNYRWSAETLEQETRRAERFGTPLALISIDLDGLKGINDTRGHAVGDAVLRHVAGKIRTAVRRIDAAARVGGDEFLVILPGTNLNGARLVARRILQGIRGDQPAWRGGELRITASVGVAAFAAGMSAKSLRESADKALYSAKFGGRDRVVCQSDART